MLELFNKLTKDEIAKFERIIDSSYFNSVEKNKTLFFYLKSIHPDISKQNISREEISKNIYPGENPSAETIWKLKSDFSKVFEKFLAQSEFESDAGVYDMSLLKALRKKGSRKEFESLLDRMKKNGSKQFFKDNTFYLNNVYLSDEEYYFRMPKIQFEFPESLQNKSDNLDYFFLFMKFHTFYEMFIHQYNNSKPFDLNKSFLTESIAFAEKNISTISKNHPNLYVIYLVLMMFSNKDDDSYTMKFRKFLKVNENKFSKIQLSYYYRYFESYYYLKINEGHVASRREVFEIYKIMFTKDLFILENSITDREFNNVINISLPLNEINWTEKYIDSYKDFIQPELAIETYNLARAKLFFYKKDFEKVFPYLNLIHYKDPHYYINSKILLGKVLYETSAYESLRSLFDSMRKYAAREKNLSSFQVQSIKNFIKHLTFITRIKEGNKKDELPIFKSMLNNEKKFISSKSWFAEKIIELEQAK